MSDDNLGSYMGISPDDPAYSDYDDDGHSFVRDTQGSYMGVAPDGWSESEDEGSYLGVEPSANPDSYMTVDPHKKKKVRKGVNAQFAGKKKPAQKGNEGSYMGVSPNDEDVDPGSYMGVNPDSDEDFEGTYLGVDPSSNADSYMAVDPHKKKKTRKGTSAEFAARQKKSNPGSYMGVSPDDDRNPGAYMGVNPDSDNEDSYLGVDPSNPGGYLGVDPHKKKKNRKGVNAQFDARQRSKGDEGSYMGVNPGDDFGNEDSYMAMEPDFTVDDDIDIEQFLSKAKQDAKQDLGYLGETEDWIDQQHALLDKQPWFKGDMTRADANKLLANSERGSFIVRSSQSQPGVYACSVMDHKVDHMLLIPSYAGKTADTPGGTRYRFGTKTKLMFNTVPKLIAYYIGHELHNTDLKLKGIVKIEEQRGGFLSDLAALDEEAEEETNPDSYLAVTPDFVVEKDVNQFVAEAAKKGAKDKKFMGCKKEWLESQHAMLERQPWFELGWNRGMANKKLWKKPQGSFVVRPSTSRPGHYACSFVEDRKVEHMLVLPSYAGNDPNVPGATRYRFGTKTKLMFNTVPKLIAYYIGHPYIDDKKLVGAVVQEDQIGGFTDI